MRLAVAVRERVVCRPPTSIIAHAHRTRGGRFTVRCTDIICTTDKYVTNRG